MSRLSDHELDTLLQDAQTIDRYTRKWMVSSGGATEPIAPRITRLLEEQRTLREQAAEREHMAAIEGVN